MTEQPIQSAVVDATVIRTRKEKNYWEGKET